MLNHAVDFTERACVHDDGPAHDRCQHDDGVGALAGVFPFDEVLRDYLLTARTTRARRATGTTRAELARHLHRCRGRAVVAQRIAADGMLPMWSARAGSGDGDPALSGPNDVKTVTSLPDIEHRQLKINQAWLISCVNARYETSSRRRASCGQESGAGR